jgi:leader peptidase (prepilin peptidase)/N-methyltransferase
MPAVKRQPHGTWIANCLSKTHPRQACFFPGLRPWYAAIKRCPHKGSRVSDAEPDADPASPVPQGEHAHPAHPNRTTVWAVLLASVAVAIAFPAMELLAELFSTPKRSFQAEGSWLEMLPMMAAGVVIAAWIFVFWSLIGSFLNVVVYRLPLGQSVVHGGSRCPRCHSAIKWHDNLPVIGWLNLHGRCRSCDLPIAARYPIVESICAGLGTAVSFRELMSGGANLPGRTPDLLHGGVLRLFPSLVPDLVGLSLYHCGTLCVLLVWGLIAWDGRRVPGRNILWVLGVAAALPVVFPPLHPLGLTGGPGTTMHAWLMQGLAVSVAGGVAGLLCGQFLQWMLARLLRGDASGRTGQPLRPPHALASGLTLVGIVCGWQGMLGTMVLLLVACLVQSLIWSAVREWPTVPTELLLVPATFLHLCGWRKLVETLGPWWPDAPTATCLAAPVAMALAVAWALVAIAPGHGRSRLPTETDPAETDPSHPV